jgi:hypothetical protein
MHVRCPRSALITHGGDCCGVAAQAEMAAGAAQEALDMAMRQMQGQLADERRQAEADKVRGGQVQPGSCCPAKINLEHMAQVASNLGDFAVSLR